RSGQGLACNEVPSDSSTTLSEGNVDNCGNTSWELIVSYLDGPYDEGPYDATGTCTGGYTDCNCNNVPVSYRTPTKGFRFSLVDSGPGYDEYQWWWVITNYSQPNLQSCASGSCAGTGYTATYPTWIDQNAGWADEIGYCRF